MKRTNFSNCTAVEMVLVQFLRAMNPKCTGSMAEGCDCTFSVAPEDKGTVAAGNILVRDTEPAGEKQVADACAKDGKVQIRIFTSKTVAGSELPVLTGNVYAGKAK